MNNLANYKFNTIAKSHSIESDQPDERKELKPDDDNNKNGNSNNKALFLGSYTLVKSNKLNSTPALVAAVALKFAMQVKDFHFESFSSSMFDLNGHVIDAIDILSLRPEQYMTDTIADFYGQRMIQRNNANDSIKVFGTSWFQSLMKSERKNSYDTIENMFGKANICSYEISTFICCTGMHFRLIAVSLTHTGVTHRIDFNAKLSN